MAIKHRITASSDVAGWFLPRSAVNDVQAESIARILKQCNGAHFTNLLIRKDGQDINEEGDWIKHLEPITSDVDRYGD